VVPEAPTRVTAPFSAEPGKAVVVWLTVRSVPPPPKAFELVPDFTASVPPHPIPELLGLSAATGWDSLLELDMTRSRVVRILATGRGPQGVALDRLGGRIYVALSEQNEIEVFDLVSGEPVVPIRLNAGDAPREVALSPDGQLLVAINAGSNTASFIDARGGVELGRVPVGVEPWSLLVDRSGVRAYVFNRRTNTITVLDLATRSIAATISTEAEPLRAALNRAGDRLYVAQAGTPYVTILKLPDLSLDRRVFVGFGTTDVLVDPRTDLLYVSKRDENRIDVYEPLQLLTFATITVPDPVSYMVIDDPRNAIVALMPERRGVAIVDLAGRRVTATLDVGDAPYALTLFQQRP